MVVVVQSYSRVAGLVGRSLERAPRKLRLDYADILLFGLWNRPLAPRILEAGLKLQSRGLARHLGLSTHQRPLAAQLASIETFGALHIRYNAEHRGAERDVFPLRPRATGPASCRSRQPPGRLLDRKRAPQGEPVPTAADCYRFVLSNPAADVCLTGPSNWEHVMQSLEGLERGPMPPEEIAWMGRVGDAVRGVHQANGKIPDCRRRKSQR
jgi:aryl-alcohol dehydrogenase-like predicted oxidoreductase